MKKVLDKIKPNSKVICNGSAWNKMKRQISHQKNGKFAKKTYSYFFHRSITCKKRYYCFKKILDHFNNSNKIKFQFLDLLNQSFLIFQKKI